MTADIYKKLADKLGVSAAKAREMAIALMDTINEEVLEKGRLFISREHYFKRLEKKPRRYHNIKTGEVALTSGYTAVIYKNIAEPAGQPAAQ